MDDIDPRAMYQKFQEALVASGLDNKTAGWVLSNKAFMYVATYITAMYDETGLTEVFGIPVVAIGNYAIDVQVVDATPASQAE